MSTSSVLHRTAIFLALFQLSAGLALAANGIKGPPYTRGTCVQLIDGKQHSSNVIPLESTEVVLDVKPGLMEAEVIQTFTNRTNTAMEAVYLFPLPDDATLTDFELRYKDRVVKSVVREKEVARFEYEVAKTEGKKAALLEKQDPTLFSTAVANFLPGETVEVVIRFIQPLTLTADEVEVRFPMVTQDRYFPSNATPRASGNYAPNPSRIPSRLIARGHVYAFDIQVAGIPVGSIESPSHQIATESTGLNQYSVSLQDEITIPDRDFVMRIKTRRGEVAEPTLVTQQTSMGDYGLLTIFPPMENIGSTRASVPRDVLFLVDCSYSMEGKRFSNAKLGLEGCLLSLFPEDRFQIVAFGSSYQFYKPDWIQAGDQAVADAVDYVRQLPLVGGTELQPALAASFDVFESNDNAQVLIVMTDGAVGNPETLIELVEEKAGKVRLFPFGIGSAPNAHLVNKIAEIGGGQARFIGDDADIEVTLIDLFETLDSPVLTDVNVSLFDVNGMPIEGVSYPHVLRDVFIKRPIQAVFQTLGGRPTTVLVEALEDGQAVTHQIAVQTTPMRGDGLEKRFGSKAYEALRKQYHSSGFGQTRDSLRQQMLETALKYQLVTEFTSRVGVAQEISDNLNQGAGGRAPDLGLKTYVVPQYHVAPFTGNFQRDEDVIVLSPFEVTSEEDSEYFATSTLSGTRLQTRLRDVGSQMTILTRQFLEDFTPVCLDEVVSYTTEPGQNPIVSRSGANAGLLDGLPIATVVDFATLERVEMRSIAPTMSGVTQVKVHEGSGGTLSGRVSDDGYAFVSADLSGELFENSEVFLRAVVSGATFGDNKWSAYLDGARWIDGGKVRGNLQMRHLSGYGDMRLATASFNKSAGDLFFFGTTVAWHRLDRDDPFQFRRDSESAECEGLGFFNLDLLTAETKRLEDAVAEAIFGIDRFGDQVRQNGYIEVRWNQQSSDWTNNPDTAVVEMQRDNAAVNVAYSVDLADGNFGIDLNVGWADHKTPGESKVSQGTKTGTVGLRWDVSDQVSLFATQSNEEFLPWVSTGFFETGSAARVARSHEIEERAGSQAGIRLGAFDYRFEASLAVFHEDVRNHAYRDWAWERDNGSLGEVLLSDGTVRMPLSYALWEQLEREGWMGSVNFMPTGNLRTLFSWYYDWKNEGPYRGGNSRASLAVRYDFREEFLRGLYVGGAASFQNAMLFNDDFELPGGVYWNLLFGYGTRAFGSEETRVQINVINLTDRSFQPTRFAPERGRRVVLSISHDF